MCSMQSSTLESATSPRAWHAWLRPWMRTKVYTGGLIVLTFIVVGILGPLAAPYDPNRQELEMMLQAPQWFGGTHFLGTDNLGVAIF